MFDVLIDNIPSDTIVYSSFGFDLASFRTLLLICISRDILMFVIITGFYLLLELLEVPISAELSRLLQRIHAIGICCPFFQQFFYC